MALIDHSVASITIRSMLHDFLLFHFPLSSNAKVTDAGHITLRSKIFTSASCGRLSDCSPSLTAEAEIFQSEQLLMLLNQSTWLVVFSVFTLTENFV